MKASASSGALKDLAAAASSASESGLLKKKDMEDLLPENQAEVLKVKDTGSGMCSKCRWKHGCLACSWEKTLKYYLNKQFGEACSRK